MEKDCNDLCLNEIEKPIRDIVFHLRNVGINTCCSCGHYMWIQGDLLDSTHTLNMINNVMSEMGIKNYFVRCGEQVKDGCKDSWFELSLPDINGQYHFETIDNKEYQPNKF
ncbi:MAG TPA: hypothetical protein PK698_07270 [Bacilli bacterium]|jgi:hypothetical protein|nr:MAG: hypothetical protein BWX59_02353 [Bacteroidetes bacterium ADurb.Bin028]HOH62250.1 hypothetical protein [Bacilli bacterium]